jgi:hypothetical protein
LRLAGGRLHGPVDKFCFLLWADVGYDKLFAYGWTAIFCIKVRVFASRVSKSFDLSSLSRSLGVSNRKKQLFIYIAIIELCKQRQICWMHRH